MACLSVIFNKPEVSYIVFSENPHEIIMGPTFRFKGPLPCCLDCHINRFIFMNGILSVSVATLSTNMNFKSILFRELSICSTKHMDPLSDFFHTSNMCPNPSAKLTLPSLFLLIGPPLLYTVFLSFSDANTPYTHVLNTVLL